MSSATILQFMIDELHFIGGTLSAASMARQDCRLPLEVRDGCSALLALRRWEFSEFTRLRRKK
jgi:hypothetical protein